MKLNTELKDEKAVKKKLEEKKPVRNRDTQTSQTETSSVCTDTLFTKIDLTFDTHDSVSRAYKVIKSRSVMHLCMHTRTTDRRAGCRNMLS